MEEPCQQIGDDRVGQSDSAEFGAGRHHTAFDKKTAPPKRGRCSYPITLAI
jgi:hypothetical protein